MLQCFICSFEITIIRSTDCNIFFLIKVVSNLYLKINRLSKADHAKLMSTSPKTMILNIPRSHNSIQQFFVHRFHLLFTTAFGLCEV